MGSACPDMKLNHSTLRLVGSGGRARLGVLVVFVAAPHSKNVMKLEAIKEVFLIRRGKSRKKSAQKRQVWPPCGFLRLQHTLHLTALSCASAHCVDTLLSDIAGSYVTAARSETHFYNTVMTLEDAGPCRGVRSACAQCRSPASSSRGRASPKAYRKK